MQAVIDRIDTKITELQATRQDVSALRRSFKDLGEGSFIEHTPQDGSITYTREQLEEARNKSA